MLQNFPILFERAWYGRLFVRSISSRYDSANFFFFWPKLFFFFDVAALVCFFRFVSITEGVGSIKKREQLVLGQKARSFAIF